MHYGLHYLQYFNDIYTMLVVDPSVYVAALLTGEKRFSAPVRLQDYPALERWPSVGAQKFDIWNRSGHSK
jgi:hypothetical protein